MPLALKMRSWLRGGAERDEVARQVDVRTCRCGCVGTLAGWGALSEGGRVGYARGRLEGSRQECRWDRRVVWWVSGMVGGWVGGVRDGGFQRKWALRHVWMACYDRPMATFGQV